MNDKEQTEHERLLELTIQHSILREAQIRAAGISSTALSRAVKQGDIERINLGLYRHPEAEWNENLSLSEVSARTPHAIVCLISALQFHQIGTQQAHSVWILLKNNEVAPKIDIPKIEVVKSGIEDSFTHGVEIHELNDIEVKITSPARTVVDCFKYRNRIGLEVCLEALRDVINNRNHKVTPDEIYKFAQLQRVKSVVHPYLEAIVAS